MTKKFGEEEWCCRLVANTMGRPNLLTVKNSERSRIHRKKSGSSQIYITTFLGHAQPLKKFPQNPLTAARIILDTKKQTVTHKCNVLGGCNATCLAVVLLTVESEENESDRSTENELHRALHPLVNHVLPILQQVQYAQRRCSQYTPTASHK